MNRPLIIGIVGGVIVVAAIALTFVIDRDGDRQTAVGPATPAAGGAHPGSPSGAAVQEPDLSAPAEVGQPSRPSFDVVRVNPEGDAVIAGRAQPNAEVTVREGKTEIGKVRADARGEWVLVPKQPLPSGSRELSLSAKKGAGPVAESDNNVVIVVPQRGKDIAGRPVDKPSGSLAILVPRDGGASTVLQTPSGAASAETAAALQEIAPAAGPGGVRQLALDSIDYDDHGKVALSGKAPPGARVQVYIDNQPLGSATAEENGRWRLNPDREVGVGLYTLRVDQLAEGGKVMARIESRFMRAEPLGDLPRDAVVFVQPGNSLWRIARRTYGRGIQYTVIFEANKDQIRNPSLIYPGQVFLVPQVN